ncbi:MAG: hypothetical protein KIH44_004585 [Octadecabacter sp.]|nr:hypothetical protein [Octadecabacter sp.]
MSGDLSLFRLLGLQRYSLTHACLASIERTVNAGPWTQVAVLGIGGLTALGFDRASEMMLVTSVNGQSVIDGFTGEILYRNREADGLDTSALKGTRLDHPADERFDMSGLYGGGLRCVTDDGWYVERLGPNCVLHPAGASVHFLGAKWADHNKDATFYLLDRSGEDIRALGFSWTGRTLVCATPSTLSVWNRPAPLAL